MFSRSIVATVTCLALCSASGVPVAWAHSGHQPRIGASHLTPSGAPEDWGTYCVTELAPMFREAIALNDTLAMNDQLFRDTTANDGGASSLDVSAIRQANRPYLTPMPPSLMDAPQEKTDAITVFVARKIVTMDPGWPEGTAVAVKDGRILSVGSLEDLEPWLKRFPYTINETFKDKVIYPGFVEAHGHPVMGSIAISRPPLSYFPLRNPYGPDFQGVKTLPEAIAALKGYVANAKSPTEPIMT